MKKEQYYFESSEDEFCHEAEYFEQRPIEVYEAVKDTMPNDTFFCKEYMEFGERGTCGKHCGKYNPCNGKNGKCKHYSLVNYSLGKKVILN